MALSKEELTKQLESVDWLIRNSMMKIEEAEKELRKHVKRKAEILKDIGPQFEKED